MIEIIDHKTLMQVGGGLRVSGQTYKSVTDCLDTAFKYMVGEVLTNALGRVFESHPVITMSIRVLKKTSVTILKYFREAEAKNKQTQEKKQDSEL